MKFDGIKEINEGKCETEQVYISNYGIIKQMLNSPNVCIPRLADYDDEEAEQESNVDNGSVYSQGLDDVSFNMQEAVNKVNKSNIVNNSTNEGSEPSAVVKEVKKEIPNVANGGQSQSNS